ncbi:hypothetical protein TeGR_g12297 [Tetraparma gracilis]|uniref:Uncharacterized protein n=1 Tax=Tetraparma gracilis TaxID=2962635 RepID=A0ABQ6MQD2_9STRA|nr:hypothetical protein TeGR_g12297 [Tetraparma gracilis]
MAVTAPLPPAKISLLLNNFVLSTSRFLNSFAESADDRLRVLGNKITDVEVMMGILESKLASVPDEDYVAAPAPAPAAAPQEAAGGGGGAAAPPPASDGAAPEAAPAPEAPAAVESTALVNQIPASQHPDYASFFKQLKVGAPLPAVQAKVEAAGLDPEFLAKDPTELIVYEGGGDLGDDE